MAQVRISEVANQDLLEIWERFYELAVYEGSEIHLRILEKLSSVFEILAGSPGMGRLRGELPGDGLRSFPAHAYVIFYIPLSDGVEITRVLHERRDTWAAFGEAEEDVT